MRLKVTATANNTIKHNLNAKNKLNEKKKHSFFGYVRIIVLETYIKIYGIYNDDDFILYG